jgi:hypothetical protein
VDLYEATTVLEEGFCLWVGAGLTLQIASGHASVPLWPKVTQEMERTFELAERSDPEYPERLDKCRRRAGDEQFRRFLRERYYTGLSAGLLTSAAQHLDRADFVPRATRQVAALGQLANPIVSFNIEPLSSLLLARPGGPVRLIPYVEPRDGLAPPSVDESSDRFKRIVFHPHGLITGDCVMTKSQYELKNATLAFGLAIHSAFGNNLAIVGMSLQEKDLQAQLLRFRSQLKRVIWLDRVFPEELLPWADRCEVDRIVVDWSAFWDYWIDRLRVAVDESSLCTAWYLVLHEAVAEVEGGALGELKRVIAQWPAGAVSADLVESVVAMAEVGRRRGEPGEPLSLDFEPQTVLQGVGNRMQEAGFDLPKVQRPNLPIA